MTISTAMMLTVTLTMTAVMVPRIYLAWLTAGSHAVEGEVEALQALLAEQNRWIGRQFFCGAASLAMLVMVKTSRHDLEIPPAMSAALAAYSVISMVLAVLESLVAQRVSRYLAEVPAQVGGNSRTRH